MRVKIVETGMIKTDFGSRSLDLVLDKTMPEYLDTAGSMKRVKAANAANPSEPQVVADVIAEAVTCGTDTLRYRAEVDAVAVLDDRKTQDEATFIGGIKQNMAR